MTDTVLDHDDIEEIEQSEEVQEHVGKSKEYQQLGIESFMKTSTTRPHSKTHEEITLENNLILHEIKEHLMNQTKTPTFPLNSDSVATSNMCNNPLLHKLKSANCLQDCLAIDNTEVSFNCTKTHEGLS